MIEDRNVKIAAWAAIAALGLNVVYAAIESGALFTLRSLTSAQIEIIEDIESLFWPLQYATFATFIAWAYLAHAHLTQMGRPHVYFRDEAAVWWWFVPVAWLVKPFQVMYETARGSLVEFTDAHWDRHRVPAIAVWWTVTLYGGWLAIGFPLSLVGSAIHGIAYLLFGTAAIVTSAMILEITQAQENPSVVSAALWWRHETAAAAPQ